MKEGKYRNGVITIEFTPTLGNDNRIRPIGWFKLSEKSGETIIYRTRPISEESYPLYLEIRSHDVFREFIGKSIVLKGNLTINEVNGQIHSAHITPVNLQLLAILREKLIFLSGKVECLLVDVKHKIH